MLATLERLEAQRRLKTIPAALLETAWVLDDRIEAVIDAVLVASTAGDDRAVVHARHTGEWASRIASELQQAPQPSFMRRCGVLARIDPAVLSRIRELREYAPAVASFQHGDDSAAARIISAAAAFDALVSAADPQDRYAPSDALRMLLKSANPRTRTVLDALRRACRNAPQHLFAVA
jgi:hypothetical protein